MVKKQFIINASQGRVWELLGGVIFNCFPVEKIDIVSDRTFNAEVKWGVAFVGLILHMRGELIDIMPPNFITVLIHVKSKNGIIQQRLKTTFALKTVNEGKTEVVCEVMPEVNNLFSRLIFKMQTSVFKNTINQMKARLEKIA